MLGGKDNFAPEQHPLAPPDEPMRRYPGASAQGLQFMEYGGVLGKPWSGAARGQVPLVVRSTQDPERGGREADDRERPEAGVQ